MAQTRSNDGNGAGPTKRATSTSIAASNHMTHGKSFSRFAHETARLSGKPVTFIAAVVAVLVWATTGPLFHYSDTWQVVINTSTTIITFLMVFLIQNTQNRDTMAAAFLRAWRCSARRPELAQIGIAVDLRELNGVPPRIRF
jgi:Low affinity iron permease